MNPFSWYDAKTIEEAQSEVSATVSETLQKNAQYKNENCEQDR